tara:strand:- start:245 stop:454 length:210 start_codon:yes stop_codon:yes gene_type:complete
MTIQNIYNVGWMSSLAQDALLQTFFSDFYELETTTDDYLQEDETKFVTEDSGIGEGILLKSDGGKLLLS